MMLASSHDKGPQYHLNIGGELVKTGLRLGKISWEKLTDYGTYAHGTNLQ